ncbi:TetR/AcrR family transcriptional regulator [Streptomyces sp. NPDC096132]|uniref:TetR/AcrR family transcriptional regulator n=1 Tax=Streptomyces sp. NPDC096132 TaxID=3366075 RepID=UPI00382FBB39
MPTVTGGAGARRRKRQAEMEQLLLAAMGRLMGEGQTFTELSVDRLASEAGMSRATFYLYFEDKSHLLRSLIAQVFAEIVETSRTWWDEFEHHDLADFHTSMSGLIATYRKHQSLVTAVVEVATYDPEVDQAYRGLMESIQDTTQGFIERGKTEGSVSESLPAKETAAALTWMAERTVHQMARVTSSDHDDRLARALAHIYWNTLYARPDDTR